jgi:hypothetical protein
MGSIVSFQGAADKAPALYYASPYSANGRVNMTILASDDSGATSPLSLSAHLHQQPCTIAAIIFSIFEHVPMEVGTEWQTRPRLGATFTRSLNLWPAEPSRGAGYTGLACGLAGKEDCGLLFDTQSHGLDFVTFSSADVK